MLGHYNNSTASLYVNGLDWRNHTEKKAWIRGNNLWNVIDCTKSKEYARPSRNLKY